MSIPNINHVILTGRLTSDPDLRTLPSGGSVCHLRIAVNARRRNPNGEWGEKPNFFDVIVFGVPGETVAKYMRAGRAIAMHGRLDWREWEAKDGGKRQAVEIVADDVQFLDSPPNDDSGDVDADDLGGLRGIAGGEEALSIADQEVTAAIGAAGGSDRTIPSVT